MIDQNVSELKLVMWLIVSLSIGIVSCEFHSNEQVDPNYFNKINKGMWHRVNVNHREGAPETSGRFFFRSISNEEEAVYPNLNYVSPLSRDKRAAPSKSRKRNIKNVKSQTNEEISSKNSLFDDFPSSVAMLLENSNNKNIDYSGYPKYETKFFNTINETSVPTQAIKSMVPKVNYTNGFDPLNDLKDILNATEANATAKRSMNYDELVVDRIDFIETFNKSKDFKAQSKNEDQMWQKAPVDTNLYEILPKESNIEIERKKPVTERGLVKVLSMLTRTFRKIMKQHNAIKLIHNDINNIDKNVDEKVNKYTKKLSDFDEKYKSIMQVIDKLKNFQECLKNKEEIYKNKEASMSKNLLYFESQQKKFLAQQQQFYNIQKMMLSQNEKINLKQTSIAKMQNEISHRQNQFSKVLKKAKQHLLRNKYPEMNLETVQTKATTEKPHTKKKESIATTVRTTSVAPVTINLFSIASNNVVENPDKMILKEKDDQSVDDLIYKYYFNNTFIDTVIKNKILGGVFGDKTNIARNAKLAAKRNQKTAQNSTKPESTILLPVNNSKLVPLKRERRWINHHSKRKHRKRYHGKGRIPDDHVIDEHSQASSTNVPETTKIIKESDVIANDPFLSMATHFCKEIGQSNTKQILDWCVEKAIRRLRSMDMKLTPQPVVVTPEPHTTIYPSTKPDIATPSTVSVTKVSDTTTTKAPPTLVTDPTQDAMAKLSRFYGSQFFPDNEELETNLKQFVSDTTTTKAPPTLVTDPTQDAMAKLSRFYGSQFFPDNEELETNLKQFDLTPDTAGNVYYDGSLHASQMIHEKSDGVSDILPGFDSNSKIDIDTKAMQLQLRRKYMRKNMPQNLWKT